MVSPYAGIEPAYFKHNGDQPISLSQFWPVV
jgi:hypothetical protein